MFSINYVNNYIFETSLQCESNQNYFAACVVPVPAWTTYAPQIKLAGIPMIAAKTAPGLEGGYKLTPELLLEAIKGHENQNISLILTNPGNPSKCPNVFFQLEHATPSRRLKI